MAKRRMCLNDPNYFCYVCGKFTFSADRRNITTLIKERYFKYFKLRIGDQDKNWAPHIICNSCSNSLSMWDRGKLKKLSFDMPMAWREPKNHSDDCYFCSIDVQGMKLFMFRFYLL
jgi:hypothetical protein